MAPEPFQYAVVRVVPQIDRAEFMNVGVIVFCRTRRFLEARVALDPRRLQALSPASTLKRSRLTSMRVSGSPRATRMPGPSRRCHSRSVSTGWRPRPAP